MASTCISNCVDARAPVRATYVNLYKWPESDVAFVRSLSLNERSNGVNGGATTAHRPHPKVVDSISCRQLYLRSYTFSRDDDDESTDKEMGKRNCLGFGKKRVGARKRKSTNSPRGSGGGGSNSADGGGRRKKCTAFERAKDISCIAFSSIFRRLLSCTTKVDVVG